MAERLVEVAPDRLTAWLDRFTANNPGPDPAQRVVRQIGDVTEVIQRNEAFEAAELSPEVVKSWPEAPQVARAWMDKIIAGGSK